MSSVSYSFLFHPHTVHKHNPQIPPLPTYFPPLSVFHHILTPPCSSLFLSSAFTLLHTRLLEHQLQTQRRTNDSEVEALRGELQNVKEENNRQQQLLAQNLQLPPEARIEASLQHEITRLTNENLVRCDMHTDTCRVRVRVR